MIYRTKQAILKEEKFLDLIFYLKHNEMATVLYRETRQFYGTNCFSKKKQED